MNFKKEVALTGIPKELPDKTGIYDTKCESCAHSEKMYSHVEEKILALRNALKIFR